MVIDSDAGADKFRKLTLKFIAASLARGVGHGISPYWGGV
jgi:hypothetical protein